MVIWDVSGTKDDPVQIRESNIEEWKEKPKRDRQKIKTCLQGNIHVF